MNVFLGIWEHEHGVDVAVYATKELAYAGLAYSVGENYQEEVENKDVRNRIRDLLYEHNWIEAVKTYSDNTFEAMRVQESEVIT